MSDRIKNTKKFAKGIILVSLVFLIGGLGGVYFDQQVLPFIRTNKYLSRINFLERAAENVTVINKTEQITIKEDDSINEIASQASNAVVNIISITQQTDPLTKAIKNVDQSGSGVLVTSDGLVATYRSAIIEKNAVYQTFLFNGKNY